MKPAACLPVLVVIVALLACKKKEEAQPLPDAALPPPVAEPAPAETAEPAAPEPAASAPAEEKPAAKPTTPVAKKDAGTTATDKKDAGTKPSTTTVSKACLEKCNAVLQGCLTPAKKDGGFPSFGDPAKCQAAFQECQAACK